MKMHVLRPVSLPPKMAEHMPLRLSPRRRRRERGKEKKREGSSPISQKSRKTSGDSLWGRGLCLMRSIAYIILTLPITSRTFQIGNLRLSRFSSQYSRGMLGFSSKSYTKAHILSCTGLLGIILLGRLMRSPYCSRTFLLRS